MSTRGNFESITEKYDYEKRSVEWWSRVQKAIDDGSKQEIDKLMMQLLSRRAGLIASINKYKRIIAGEDDPGLTTLAICHMSGVDYSSVMEDRMRGCLRLFGETNEQIDIVRNWNV